MFRGTFTALVTPFREGAVDYTALEGLIESQIAAGIDGIVAVGTTGESPTLTHDERKEVIRFSIQTANKRCLVLAGTGSYSTREAISATKQAEKMGVDGALVVAPYYNKPTQEGLFRHFSAIAKSTGLRIMLYNIPGRCGVHIAAETVARMESDCPNVVSIKGAFARRIHDLERRRWIDPAVFGGGCSWIGQRGVEFVASGNVRTRTRDDERGHQARGRAAPPALLVVQRFIYRAESGADKNRALVARGYVGRGAFAAVRDERGKPGPPAQDPGGIRTWPVSNKEQLFPTPVRRRTCRRNQMGVSRPPSFLILPCER